MSFSYMAKPLTTTSPLVNLATYFISFAGTDLARVRKSAPGERLWSKPDSKRGWLTDDRQMAFRQEISATQGLLHLLGKGPACELFHSTGNKHQGDREMYHFQNSLTAFGSTDDISPSNDFISHLFVLKSTGSRDQIRADGQRPESHLSVTMRMMPLYRNAKKSIALVLGDNSCAARLFKAATPLRYRLTLDLPCRGA